MKKWNISYIKFLGKSGLLIEGISEAIKDEAKEKKVDFSQCY